MFSIKEWNFEEYEAAVEYAESQANQQNPSAEFLPEEK